MIKIVIILSIISFIVGGLIGAVDIHYYHKCKHKIYSFVSNESINEIIFDDLFSNEYKIPLFHESRFYGKHNDHSIYIEWYVDLINNVIFVTFDGNRSIEYRYSSPRKLLKRLPESYSDMDTFIVQARIRMFCLYETDVKMRSEPELLIFK